MRQKNKIISSQENLAKLKNSKKKMKTTDVKVIEGISFEQEQFNRLKYPILATYEACY